MFVLNGRQHSHSLSLSLMHPRKKRKHQNEIRDTIDSEDENSDNEFMNTRESRYDDRGRLLSMSVSPQKKTKETWATRRAWEPPVDLEVGLDAEPHFSDQALDGGAYNGSGLEPRKSVTVRKQKRTLRSVGALP